MNKDKIWRRTVDIIFILLLIGLIYEAGSVYMETKSEGTACLMDPVQFFVDEVNRQSNKYAQCSCYVDGQELMFNRE